MQTTDVVDDERKKERVESGGWGKWTRSFILCVINNHIIIVSICWLRRSYSICTLRPDLNLLVKWEMETWNEWVRIQQNFPFDQHGNSNMLQFAELQSSALSLKSTFFSLYCSSYPTQIKCTETRSWAEAQLRSVRVNDFSHFFLLFHSSAHFWRRSACSHFPSSVDYFVILRTNKRAKEGEDCRVRVVRCCVVAPFCSFSSFFQA